MATYTGLKSALKAFYQKLIPSHYFSTSSSYIKFANGLLIQWGKNSSGCGSTSTINYKTITLPLSYTSSTSYVAVVSGKAAGSATKHSCSVHNMSIKNFQTCEVYNDAHRWITIGY